MRELRREKKLIDGIQVGDLIATGGTSEVYEASIDQQRYAIKISKNASHDDKLLRDFRREAALLSQIDHPNLPIIKSVGESEQYPYTVMERLYLPNLSQVIQGGSLSNSSLHRLALKICDVLSHVHASGILHKDIKPENIFWDEETADLKLIDFGLSAETKASIENEVAGTLDYMSPEQFGVLKRSVDARSDLYSLGVVLYECATGRLPYSHPDPGELARQHLLAPLPSVRAVNNQITPALEQIILGLLAKDPDDRFPSAEALAEALLLADPSLNIPFKPKKSGFVGRAPELQILEKCLADLDVGQGNSIVIQGESGSGKSQLFGYFLRHRHQQLPLVLRGVCNKATPFAAIKGLLASADTNLTDEHRNTLRQNTGFMTRALLLKATFPELNALLTDPDQSSSRHINSDEEFVDAIVELLADICASFPKAVVLVDDIQWHDRITGDVLQRLVAHAKSNPLLVGMTCRNEPQHISDTLAITESASHIIPLAAFSLDDVVALVRNILGGLPFDSEFSDFVYKQTNGIPFSVQEYIRFIIHAGVIFPNWGKWDVDYSRLRSLDLPRNAVALVVNRISKLPDATRKALKAASVIGKTFSTATLSDICENKAEVMHALTDGRFHHLVEPLNATHWRFVHDRIHEAFQQDTSLDVNELNLKIAQSLSRADHKPADVIYQIAEHLWNHGQQNKAAFDATIQAAYCAKDNIAIDQASIFFERAEIIARTLNEEITFAEDFADICQQKGRFQQAADLFEVAIQKTKDKYHRARLHGKRAYGYTSNLQSAQGLQESGRAFRAMGWSKPTITRGLFAMPWHLLVAVHGVYFRRYKKPLAGAEYKKLETIVSIHQQYGFAKFFDLDSSLMFLASLRVFGRALKLGPSKPLVYLCGNFVVSCGIIGWRRGLEWFANLAIQTARKVGDPALISHAEAYRGFGFGYAGRELEAERIGFEVLSRYRDSLQLENFMFVVGTIVSSATLRGLPLQVIEVLEAELAYLDTRFRSDHALKNHYKVWFQIYALTCLVILGRSLEAQKYQKDLDAYFAEHPDDKYHNALFCYAQTQVHLEQGEFGQSVEDVITKFDEMEFIVPFIPMQPRHFFVAKTYVRLRQLERATPDDKAVATQKLRRAMRELLIGSDTKMLKSHYYAIKGQFLLGKGQHKQGLKALDRANKLALEVNNQSAIFEVIVAKARHMRQQGVIETSENLVLAAQDMCRTFGWYERERMLAEEFPLSTKSATKNRTKGPSYGHAGSADINVELSKRVLDSLVKVAVAASSSIDPLEQAHLSLDETIRVLGADRAALFLDQKAQNERLEFFAGRSSEGHSFDELTGYSSTVVKKVWDTQEPLVLSGTKSGQSIGSASAVLFDLRSVMATPVLVGGTKIGVLYVDNRFAGGVFGADNLRILEAIGTQIGIAIQRARSLQMQIETAEMEKDLELTGAVQQLLIPKDSELRHADYRLKSFYMPANRSGGDWIWHEPTNDGFVAMIGDVTGHGPGPAMITALVAGVFMASKHLPPAEILTSINQKMYELTGNAYLMTALILRLSGDDLTIVSAGHPPAFLWSGTKQTVKSQVLMSNPLGLAVNDYQVASRTIALIPKDRLLIYTDGAYEFSMADGSQFNKRRLRDLYAAQGGKNFDEAFADFRTCLLEKAAGELDDDLAFLIVERS